MDTNKKKKKCNKIINIPLIIWSESELLQEIKQHIILLEKRLFVLQQLLIEEKNMNSKINYN